MTADALLDPRGAALPGAPLALLLAAQAQRDPNRIALTLTDGALTRAELEKRSNQRARQLQEAGVGHDDVVVFALPNGAAYYELIYGVWKLGATPIHVSHKLTPREFAEIISLAQPKLTLTADLPLCAADPGAFDDSSLPLKIASRWKISTSGGSTGRPKLIVDPNPALWGVEKQGHRRLPDSTIINPGPLYHSAPFGMMIPALGEGCHVVEIGRFDAETYLANVERHRATWAYLVPTMMARIANLPAHVLAKYDISSLHTLLHMAAICPPAVKRAWIDLLGADAVWEIYGGSERIGSTIIGGTEWLAHPGSVGRPREGIDLQILDEQGAPLPAGAVGEIFFRRAGGPESTFLYIGAEARRRGDWASFGDMGWIDSEGYLYIADRRTDMIVSGGINIFPAEIEAQIATLPGVVDSVVAGAPHADLGAVPHAFVQLQTDSPRWSEASLLTALRERLAPHKLPRAITFVDQPLRDDSGKVRRAEWRDRLLAQSR
ncbi:MAG: AMP-binding protein [Hydrogenophilaceae bacterium]|jgi:bile acid-coenzyme A ligase|nr:AMP-binding protein [Hydrogenophilaceae bacterium]